MFIEDLSTNCYFASGVNLRAVGWLEQGHEYRRGDVPQQFLAKLKEHVTEAYQPYYFMGFHSCSLCQPEKRAHGLRNVFIPTRSLLYIAPELIVHYIECH